MWFVFAGVLTKELERNDRQRRGFGVGRVGRRGQGFAVVVFVAAERLGAAVRQRTGGPVGRLRGPVRTRNDDAGAQRAVGGGASQGRAAAVAAARAPGRCRSGRSPRIRRPPPPVVGRAGRRRRRRGQRRGDLQDAQPPRTGVQPVGRIFQRTVPSTTFFFALFTQCPSRSSKKKP